MIFENLFSSRALQECMHKINQLEQMRPLLLALEKAIHHSSVQELPIRLEPIEDGSNNYGLFMLDSISHYPTFDKLKNADFKLISRDALNRCPMRCVQQMGRMQITLDSKNENLLSH